MDIEMLVSLKTSAKNFGFDDQWINSQDPDVLATAVEAARNGISASTIAEIINKVGPIIIQLIVEWLNNKNMRQEIK